MQALDLLQNCNILQGKFSSILALGALPLNPRQGGADKSHRHAPGPPWR